MSAHLFLMTIGPVQEFIAGARRTRDLWFGSWLLSELSRTAADAIQQHGGELQLIFPPQDAVNNRDSSLANVANKILARVSADPQTLSEQVVTRVRERLREIWQLAREQFTGIIDTQTADKQIDDLLEIYWAAVALPSDDVYALARRRLEALMAARKTTRDFAQVTWGATVPKSSIDGQRESVIDEASYPDRGMAQAERKVLVDALYRNYRAGPAERLSGVDLLKRHGSVSATARYFPSTSDIAVRPVLARITRTRDEATSAWHAFLAAIQTLADRRLDEERVQVPHPILGNYDGGLLLESRLYELIDDREQRRKASKALADFFATLKAPRPEPYYAVLLADGDRMGATIDNQRTIARHVELSRRLGLFAAEARRIVSQHDGALIYAGGDDVLAFVPLHTLLDCARMLHDRFGAMINPADGQEQFEDEQEYRPTLSVGIAICHQIEPLSDALNLAREAEQAAKRVDGKDALALTLSKRSGAAITISGKWDVLDAELAAFATLHRIEALPDGAAFQWRDLAERLTPRRGNATLPPAAVLAEAKRILGRKEPARGRQQLAEATRTHLHRSLEAVIDRQGASTAALAGLRAVADQLIVARILATAADHADLHY